MIGCPVKASKGQELRTQDLELNTFISVGYFCQTLFSDLETTSSLFSNLGELKVYLGLGNSEALYYSEKVKGYLLYY